MYRTKLYGPEMHEAVSGLCLGSSSTTNSGYNSEIPYSDKVEMVNGVPTLVDPTTGKFTTLSSFSSLKGKYIKLDGAAYLVPSNATITWTLRNSLYEAHVVTAQRVLSVEFTIYSGVGEKNAIRSCNITYAANDGDDLMLGSVCSACLETTIVARGGNLSIGAGAEVVVYKVAEDGAETQIGVFTCEQPTKLTANTYKILAYDNVRKLDVDMTEWLRSLTEWPYAVTDFYTMICEECGLTGRWTSWTGISDYMVHQFDVEKSVTGRQLVSWCAEVMGDYCIANADGSLQCQWYRRGYIELFPYDAPDEKDATTYYQDSLSYDDFLVEDVGEVLCRADRDGEKWGVVIDENLTGNPYIITGNPLLLMHPTYGSTSTLNNSVYTALSKIGGRFNFIRYQPFRVSIPEFLPAQIGYFVWLRTDKGSIYAPITNMTWFGQRMTLECTANRFRKQDDLETMSNRQLLEEAGTTSAKQVADVTTSAQPVSVPVQRVVDAGRRPRAMVSFTDDDCRAKVYKNIVDGVDRGLFALIKSTGIPYTLACPPGNIGDIDGTYMTKQQLLEMYRAGVEIACHTWKETNMTEYASAEALEEDLADCMAIYRQWGIQGVEAYAYCQGVYEDDYITAVKNHFRVGFTVTKGVNQIPYESYYLKRVEVFPKDGSYTLDDVKAYVDQVATEGGWLILMTHAWYETFDSAAMRDDLIPYIRSKGVEIVSVSEAIRTTGNVVDTGVFRKPLTDAIRPYFVVDAQGRAWANKLELMTLPDGHENVELDLQLGKLLNLNDGTSGGTTVTPASKDPAYRVCRPVDIRGCKSVIVSGWAYGGWGIVSFRDASNAVIECYYSDTESTYENGTYLDHLEIQVPEGATKIAVAGNLYKKLPTLRKVYEVETMRTAGQTMTAAINELYTMMRVLDGSATTRELSPEVFDDTWISGTSGKILGDQGDYPGVRITSHRWAVLPGETYLVSCSAFNGRGLYTILDADRNPVAFRPSAGTEEGTILTDYMVTIPAQGAQIVLAADLSMEGVEGFALKKVTGW